MNFMIIFTKYDVTIEFLMLALSFVLLIVMAIARPSGTKMLHLNKIGFLTAILTIFVHLHLLYLTCKPEIYSKAELYFCYILYAILYIAILNEITVYIDFLSYEKRTKSKSILFKIICQSILYYILLLYPLFSNKIFIITKSDIVLSKWMYCFEICGLICAFCAFLSTLIRIKTLSKIVAIGTLLFIPLDSVVLIFQIWFKTAFFISISYVVPFIIFYLIFHSSKFDEIAGCQDSETLYTVINTASTRKKLYAVIKVSFPQLKNRESSDIKSMIDEISSKVCRKIELIKFGGRIYSHNIYSYSLFVKIENDEEAYEIANKIREILEQPLIYNGKKLKAYYKQVVITSNLIIDNAVKYRGLCGYMESKLTDDLVSEFVIAQQEDYEKFMQAFEVEQALLDIRTTGNLNDSRIITYIQPIHDIHENKYMTGEALMRMELKDKMIYPDIFIPVAERNNCIHTLTLIILNSVCKIIKELETNYYNFNGINVNVSTSELSDPDFYKEILKIAYENQIDPGHLRIEITESISVTNYDTVYKNMEELNKHGILFYLDDYGTGYSNLERIIKFPFDTIKFDKSILYSALDNEKANSLLKTQVEYFRQNNYHTVVEGVENEEMFDFCKNIGFDMIQGYYFSRPQPAEDIINYFES